MTGWRNVAIGAFFMVAFVASVILAVETLYKGPKYEDFFRPPPAAVYDKETCEKVGGKWSDQNTDPYPKRYPYAEPARPDPAPNNDVIVPPPTGWCDVAFYANQKWEAARASHDRNAAIGVGIVAVAAFVLGLFWKAIPVSLQGGLAGAGIALVVYDLARYSERMNENLRLGMVVAIVVFLVILALRYGKERSSKKDGKQG